MASWLLSIASLARLLAKTIQSVTAGWSCITKVSTKTRDQNMVSLLFRLNLKSTNPAKICRTNRLNFKDFTSQDWLYNPSNEVTKNHL